MKTIYSKQEGVKMNSDLDFGGTKDIQNQFQYLMDTLETPLNEEFKYFYRVTDDNFIQLAYSYNESELTIIAQYRLRFQNLKENINFIVNNNIEAKCPYNGYPTFENSSVFTKQEFEAIITTLKNSNKAITDKAFEHTTPFINFLKENNLHPFPSGDFYTNWNARCPSGRSHFITISTEKDEWGCGYCRREGKQAELEKWLLEIKEAS
ncbi:hypothetical protein [Aequorivita capsosiphonis]|uniref:hypothetical protein n=1 Tax=Aequorivita capsosiphonis TaxID=487317 RepID=UPI000402BAB1|nr:hypothetical protein [Aequorivita capsosiphonis]